MKIITEEILTEFIKKYGFKQFLMDLMKVIKQDFSRWDEFNIIPRPAMHVPGGVLELMPVCDNQFYAYKYVNCHPENIKCNLATVVATGQLSRIDTGYPIMFSEMTLLTALRTAATTAIATDLMSRKNSKILAMIGTGAQSEFLVNAISMVRNISEIRYFDIDESAMDKFEENLEGSGLKLVRCQNAEDAVLKADIITTCTACRAHVDVLKNAWIKPGVHINGIGGDSEGKTELEFSILSRCKIVVEYFDQCVIEGEIQRYNREEAKKKVLAELHELITGKKQIRSSDDEITMYDAVGIALEDFSALSFLYEMSEKYNFGENLNFTPNISNPKNLISMIL
ncbi:MAG: hypothetical protein ACD_18C00345G0002 [uncultured bacterium]|nr:MAG: hypothetical protein ACD_18C00345G0002 [uncultured bacterium]